jgi:hypothetical protein
LSKDHQDHQDHLVLLDREELMVRMVKTVQTVRLVQTEYVFQENVLRSVHVLIPLIVLVVVEVEMEVDAQSQQEDVVLEEDGMKPSVIVKSAVISMVYHAELDCVYVLNARLHQQISKPCKRTSMTVIRRQAHSSSVIGRKFLRSRTKQIRESRYKCLILG